MRPRTATLSIHSSALEKAPWFRNPNESLAARSVILSRSERRMVRMLLSAIGEKKRRKLEVPRRRRNVKKEKKRNMEKRLRQKKKREKERREEKRKRGGWYPSRCVAFEGTMVLCVRVEIRMGPREGRIYKEKRERHERKTGRGKKERDTRCRGGHEEEDDGSEASSTVLGYSLPVSWGPRCTRTILFLFLFFATHSPFPLFSSTGGGVQIFSSFLFIVSFLLPVPSSPLPASLATFLRLRRLYLFPSFFSPCVRLPSHLLNSVTKPSSHLFNALLAFQDPPRRSTATLQPRDLCTRVLPHPLSLSLSLSFFFCLSPRPFETSSSVYSHVERVCKIRYHLITILEQEQTLDDFSTARGAWLFFLPLPLFTSVTLMVFRYVLWGDSRTFKRLGG